MNFVKGVVLLLALALSSGYLWNSLAAQEKKEKDESAAVTPEQLEHAKTLFTERCARCHGLDGTSNTVLGNMLEAPNFTDARWWKEGDTSDKRFIKSITEGKDEMPAFGKKLTRQEIVSLIAYVRRFNKSAR
ncbi:MAG: cytochrome c [Acidobacteriota bacterium]|nr:cytochrome c [Acidobacteriota bacterium]